MIYISNIKKCKDKFKKGSNPVIIPVWYGRNAPVAIIITKKFLYKYGRKELYMSIRVEDIYKAFPNFKPADMQRLCGTKNYNDKTIVNLKNIAAFGNKDLSIFTARKEGENFINLLPENQRTDFNVMAGVKAPSDNKKNKFINVYKYI